MSFAQNKWLVCLLLIICLPLAGIAADYQVEIIVFKNTTSSPPVQLASLQPTLDEQPNTVPLLEETAAEETPGQELDLMLNPDGYQLLAAKQFQLQDTAEKLQQSADYELLAHLAWHQDMDKPNQAINLASAIPPESPVTGLLWLRKVNRYFHAKVQTKLHTIDSETDNSTSFLNQQQRLRLGELVYFDHPAFGILLQINRYQEPEPDPSLSDEEDDWLPDLQ